MQSNEQKILSTWPKIIPELSAEQYKARDGFMRGWLELLPKKYGIVEKFNQGWAASLPKRDSKIKTLEVGAGLGEHASWEDLSNQDYYQLDYRKEFCDLLKEKFPADRVIHGDIQEPLNLEPQSFDRVLALHVLEHLPRLTDALVEIYRVLKKDGDFDIVIPCEGGFAYSIARKISAQRYFEKTFKMDYIPIVRTEHVNLGHEIVDLLKLFFTIKTSSFFPLKIPIFTMNLVYGMRLQRRPDEEVKKLLKDSPQYLTRLFPEKNKIELAKDVELSL